MTKQSSFDWSPVVAEAHDFEPREHARTTDPDTSHAAARAVTDVAKVKAHVRAIHERHVEGLTDEQLGKIYQDNWPGVRSVEAYASARKRRSDLAREGVLYDSGERRQLSSGRTGIVWKLTRRSLTPNY